MIATSDPRSLPGGAAAKPSAARRLLYALGLLVPETRPANPADLAQRIDMLAAARLWQIRMPADVMALYRERAASHHRRLTAVWALLLGLLNLLGIGFDLPMLPRAEWPLALALRGLVSLVYLAGALAVSRNWLRGNEQLFVLLIGTLTLLAGGAIGLRSGDAALFIDCLTMGIAFVCTGILFGRMEMRAVTLFIVILCLMLARLVAEAPLPLAVQWQLFTFYTLFMSGLAFARHMQNLTLYRLFLNLLRDEVHTLEISRRNQQLSSIAYTDALTGVANRRYFDELLDTITASPAAFLPLGICMIDIDLFKIFNDRLGHLQGDRCLAAVAATIRENLRRHDDTVARYGGEEFILILPRTDQRTALEIVERIRRAVLALNYANPGAPLGLVSISAGLAVAGSAPDMGQLLQNADKALYRAKRNGRNQVCV